MHALTVSEVARRAGVGSDTVRFYEREGLIEAPPRRPSGYRQYPEDTVPLIRFIKRAQDLGFTLKQIEELISLRDDGSRNRDEVRALASAKLQDIDRKLARLQSMRSALAGMLEVCACGRPTSCPILQALDDPNDPSTP
jgi:MerR family copper efflux transcriptional regulator